MSVTIDFCDYSNATTQTSLASGLDVKEGQSFTGDGHTLNGAAFGMRKNGSPTGNAVAKIYAHTGTYGTSSLPTGSALATSDNFDVSTLTTTFAPTLLTFSGANQIVLTNATNYFLSLEYSGGDISNSIQIQEHRQFGGGADPTHPGNRAFDNGGGYTVNNIFDLCFYVYGKDPFVPSGSLIFFA